MPNSAMSAGITAPVNGIFSTGKPGAPLPAIPQQPTTEAPQRRTTAVALLRNGVTVPVTCPDWCTRDHATEGLVDITDLMHTGARSRVEVFDGAGSLVMDPLDVEITQDPFSNANPHTSLTFTDGESVDVPLTVEKALEIGAALVQHGLRVQQIAMQYAAIQAAENGGA